MRNFKKGLVIILAGIIIMFYGCSGISDPHLVNHDKVNVQKIEIGEISTQIPFPADPDFSKLDKLHSETPRKKLEPIKLSVFLEPLENEVEKSEEPSKKVDEIIDQKNLDARRDPKESSFNNALVEYKYEGNAVYSIYTAVSRITDIRFENEEQILSVSAGDTVNWLIEYVSGSNRPHLLIKPVHFGLSTNLTVITDKRTYYLHLKSWKETSMTACEWVYSANKSSIKLPKPRYEEASIPKNQDSNFEVESACDDCLPPESVFEKNGKMVLRMPQATVHTSLPVLFSVDDKGNEGTINYRVKEGPEFIIDGAFNKLVLKYPGSKVKDRKVFIYRSGHKPKKFFGNFFNIDK